MQQRIPQSQLPKESARLTQPTPPMAGTTLVDMVLPVDFGQSLDDEAIWQPCTFGHEVVRYQAQGRIHRRRLFVMCC